MRHRVIRRLYGAALRLLPVPIRRKHGRAMKELFAQQLERASARGGLPLVRAVLSGLSDVVVRGVYERFRALSTNHHSRHEHLMSTLLTDLRYAFRSLWRAPRFTLLAVLTLALGIGANVALFSVVHGVVLRPLPFPEAERVTHLAWDRGGSGPLVTMPAYKFEFWRERSRAFEEVATWRNPTLHLGDERDGDPVRALTVSHGFLEVVGWEPALGRGLTAEDDRPGAPDVAILGHGLWASRFGGDPGVIGGTVEIEGAPHTVIGVLPPEFAFPQEPESGEVLLPLRLEADPLDEGENWPILARLAPDVEPEDAEADLARVYRAFAGEHPDLINENDRAMVLASYQELYLDGVDDVLWVLMGATLLVLLIACANVAALLLARGTSRRGELAVRTALGAGRGRLVRQILGESLLLALAASGMGLLFARFGVGALLGLYPGRLPRAEWIGLDGPIALYAVMAALVTGVVFGLVGAAPVMRGEVASSALRESGRGGTRRGRLREVVLATEAAVSMVLLVGAGLLIATLAEIRSVDPGFETEDLLTAPLPEPSGGWAMAGGPPESSSDHEEGLPGVPGAGSSAEGIRAVERRALEEIRAIPGVVSAAAASTWPLRRGLNIPVGIQGRPDAYEGAVEWRSVTPAYLETLGVPLLRGRPIDQTDAEGAPRVALVNRAFADRYFPGEEALGRRIEIGRYEDRFIHPAFDVGGTEIIGVVEDVREIDLTVQPRRTVYVPAAQAPGVLVSPPVLLVRHRGEGVRAALRGVLAGVAGGGPPPEIRAMEEVVAGSVAEERFNALLMTIFAAVALLLTAFGIYGVVSYGVRQRTREIGIRMALGAERSEVTRWVMAQGMVPVLVGLLVGVVAAVGLGRFLESLLWGVQATDPVTIVSVAGLLAAVSAASSWIPVREATRIDPNRSLRPQ